MEYFRPKYIRLLRPRELKMQCTLNFGLAMTKVYEWGSKISKTPSHRHCEAADKNAKIFGLLTAAEAN